MIVQFGPNPETLGIPRLSRMQICPVHRQLPPPAAPVHLAGIAICPRVEEAGATEMSPNRNGCSH